MNPMKHSELDAGFVKNYEHSLFHIFLKPFENTFSIRITKDNKYVLKNISNNSFIGTKLSHSEKLIKSKYLKDFNKIREYFNNNEVEIFFDLLTAEEVFSSNFPVENGSALIVHDIYLNKNWVNVDDLFDAIKNTEKLSTNLFLGVDRLSNETSQKLINDLVDYNVNYYQIILQPIIQDFSYDKRNVACLNNSLSTKDIEEEISEDVFKILKARYLNDKERKNFSSIISSKKINLKKNKSQAYKELSKYIKSNSQKEIKSIAERNNLPKDKVEKIFARKAQIIISQALNYSTGSK